jgi:glutamine amidotransferase
MGWNTIINKQNKLFEGLNDPYLYFVHSYHAITKEENIIGKTIYGYEFASAVCKDNIYGFQPHPEKSHNNGIQILKNFIQL